MELFSHWGKGGTRIKWESPTRGPFPPRYDGSLKLGIETVTQPATNSQHFYASSSIRPIARRDLSATSSGTWTSWTMFLREVATFSSVIDFMYWQTASSFTGRKVLSGFCFLIRCRIPVSVATRNLLLADSRACLTIPSVEKTWVS